MSTTSTTPSTSGPTALPSVSRARTVPAEDLEAMLATDDDVVETALIPTLAFRDAVEESASPGKDPVASTTQAVGATTAARVATVPTIDAAPAEAETVPESDLERVVPPVGHSLRSRHASPESIAAVRRNLIAVCCVVVSVVAIGIAVGLVGGWMAIAAYALLVVVAAAALRRANARYAPRHSRYTARHA
ncbi:hypothetical protein O9K63_10815 [Janibacter cremeus]|uniref:hypothetical protein n=1 Tax=Janibacter cremeus TaxID=1285192 RepID=UPI0023F89AAF|nr:hypothetical protein [Janibacter cremeus]WEV77083.1 hypothetical protein O9K63_10815 [Janibacter cremeus]